MGLLPLISYAQNGEDIVLHRAFEGCAGGLYVDLGADDPVVGSVTKHFYDRGWRGINVEPGLNFPRLAASRPNDVNLNMAISDHEGTVTLFENPRFPGLSSLETRPFELSGVAPPFKSMVAAWLGEGGPERSGRTVDAIRLSTLFECHVGSRTIDFLKVDVEGHEKAVLQSNDWQRFRPRVVVAEATWPLTREPSWPDWEHILLEADYRLALSDGLNRFYVRGESPELFVPTSEPASVLDGFVAWALVDAQARSSQAEAALEAARGMAKQFESEAASLRNLTESLTADRAALLAHLRFSRSAEQELEKLRLGTGTLSLPAAVSLARMVHSTWQKTQFAAAWIIAQRSPQRNR